MMLASSLISFYRFAEVVSVVYDGDLSKTKEEAYQKFRERQIKEATAGG